MFQNEITHYLVELSYGMMGQDETFGVMVLLEVDETLFRMVANRQDFLLEKDGCRLNHANGLGAMMTSVEEVRLLDERRKLVLAEVQLRGGNLDEAGVTDDGWLLEVGHMVAVTAVKVLLLREMEHLTMQLLHLVQRRMSRLRKYVTVHRNHVAFADVVAGSVVEVVRLLEGEHGSAVA